MPSRDKDYSSLVDAESPKSLEHVIRSDLYPKPAAQHVHETGLCGALSYTPNTPFSCLPGESVLFRSAFDRTLLVVTQFRLFVLLSAGRDGLFNVPLLAIDFVECRDLFFLHIFCKDGRTFKIAFDNNDICLAWFRVISDRITIPSNPKELFAYRCFAWYSDEAPENSLNLHHVPAWDSSAVVFNEFNRLKFSSELWRVVDLNKDYNVCPTYPAFWICPKVVSDEQIAAACKYRTLQRLPVVVWRHPQRHAVLLRSSQPQPSILGWQDKDDEKNLLSVLEACNAEQSVAGETPKRLLILDARSYGAAFANRAKGGGYETESKDCEVRFMGLPNIHTVRKSFQQLRTIISNSPQDNGKGWWPLVEATNWLQNLSLLLRAALEVVEAMHAHGRPVLVHCSDGWDRTTQIVTLAKLIMDPYFRTLRGFQQLVERDWIEFGHKFSDRGGVCSDDVNEKAPVFLQWLDAVQQLMSQFQCQFEFNSVYLLKVAQHSLSGLFGTFLFNSHAERIKYNADKSAFSLWSLLHPRNREFCNILYDPTLDSTCPMDFVPLSPKWDIRFLSLWHEFYSGSHCIDGARERTRTGSFTLLPQMTASGTLLGEEPRSPPVDVTCKSTIDSLMALASGADTETEGTQTPYGLGDVTPTLAPPVGTDRSPDENEQVSLVLENMINSVTVDDGNDLVPGPEDLTPRESPAPMSLASNDLFSQSLIDAALAGPLPPGSVESSLTASAMATGVICEMATSTSDISDSRVVKRYHQMSNGTALVHGETNYSALKSQLGTHGDKFLGRLYDRVQGILLNGSDGISVDRMRSTQVIPTRLLRYRLCKESCSTGPRQRHISEWMDADGLLKISDPVQDRMRSITSQYKEYIAYLEEQNRQFRLNEQFRRCQICKTAVNGYTNGCQQRNGFHSDTSNSSGRTPSGGSDVGSWEALDEREGEPTRWVPDHAVTACAGCETHFWIACRKHHCRSCGKVFCNNCTSYECPVPGEQLYDPVRVCFACFRVLSPPHQQQATEQLPIEQEVIS